MSSVKILAGASAGCVMVWVAYYLGGGDFSRGANLGLTWVLSSLASLFGAMLVAMAVDSAAKPKATKK